MLGLGTILSFWRGPPVYVLHFDINFRDAVPPRLHTFKRLKVLDAAPRFETLSKMYGGGGNEVVWEGD